jgi:hypothetical protein
MVVHTCGSSCVGDRGRRNLVQGLPLVEVGGIETLSEK